VVGLLLTKSDQPELMQEDGDTSAGGSSVVSRVRFGQELAGGEDRERNLAKGGDREIALLLVV
jgi:hypothetical protein